MNKSLTFSVLGSMFFFARALAEKSHSNNESDSVGTQANVLLGFGLVIFGASLSTLGSMTLFLDIPLRLVPGFSSDFSLSTSKSFLASSLSFSTGVLVTTIFINLIPEGISSFHCSDLFSHYSGLAAALYFGACTALVLFSKVMSSKYESWKGSRKKMLDRTDISIPLPAILSAPELQERVARPDTVVLEQCPSYANSDIPDRKKFKKLGYEVAIAIALHNFPEGVVLFVSAYKSFHTGVLFGTALALHKFPEGIMIGIPVFFGTGSKWMATGITAAASFITQLLGATFAFILFKLYWNDIIAGLLFLLAASILIHTAFHGMLPLARQYDPNDNYCTTWLCAGVVTFIFLTSVVKDPSTGTC